MSLNVSNPNDDISTDGGNPPTLGGQNPLVADNATVTANSVGNVSRWVMDTAAGSTGVEDGANTWAKIGTFTLGTQNNNLASISLSISSSNVSTDICLVDIVIYQSGGTGLNVAAGAGIEIKSISHQYGMLSYNSFKLTQTAATNGSPVDLWVNKKLNFGKLKVIELASNFIDDNSYLNYNNNAAWQSATPSGAVNITSDWASIRGSFVPAIEGTTTAGAGTYSSQVGQYELNGKVCTANIILQWTEHTGTGNMKIAGLPFNSFSTTTQYLSSFYVNGLTYTGDGIQGYIPANTSGIFLTSVTSGTAVTALAMDTSAQIAITFTYMIA